MENIDRVSRCFVGKKVLITGGTGFIGKVLIERLLRVCPEIDELILIIRPRKGHDVNQRVEEMFKNPVFGKLLSTRSLPDVMSKVTVVNGDMSERELGLSKKDRDICKTANVIIHSAANVRFDQDIKTIVLLNTRGTRYMLELAKECPNLKVMVHVSTAYCQPGLKVLEDKLYPPPADPHEMIKMVEAMDDKTSDVLSAKLIGDYPNTYAFSKALSEAIVGEYMNDIPVVIARPSIVAPTLWEPFPGWTDNINGPLGLAMGVGSGVVRTIFGDGSSQADLMPVDLVVNVIISLIWDYMENGQIYKVMNIAASDEVIVTWKRTIEMAMVTATSKAPFEKILWYPGASMTNNIMVHQLRVLLFHWIPAIIVDMLLLCLGYKPFLIHIQKRISNGSSILEFYSNNRWFFKVDQMRFLKQRMNNLEQDIYVMDSRGFDLQTYTDHLILSARRFILKQKDESIPKAKRRVQIYKIVHYTIKGMVYLWISYLVVKYLYVYLF